MKQQLLSIAEYMESLEQRIAALESANIALQDTINALQDKLDNLEPIESPEPLESLEPLDTPAPEPAPEPEPTPEPAPEPIHRFTDSPIHQTTEPSLFGPQVDNIRQAISLGDRFLFQRELFHNNGELMQKTLDEINACASMDEALERIAPLDWDQESTTYKLFLNVLKRRF